MLSGLELVAALAIVFVGATVVGTVSFGLGLVVAPILLLFVAPQSTVVMVNSLTAILLLIVLIHTRSHFDLRLIAGTAVGGLVAVPLGVLALDTASPAILRIAIGVVILCLAPLAIANVELPLAHKRMTGPVIGFLTSLSVTTLTIGGPLVAIYVLARRWPPQVMRACLAFYFLIANILAFGLYTQAGMVDRDTLANIGTLIPSVLLGFGLATLLVRRMDTQVFRYVAATVIIVGGTVLLGRELFRL
ncbi:MAG: hypothetical protein BZY81_07155 [SAR202 cluster bacterium Io17-Chloro-G4]|nr:MAG: hypothetical protein BZY81_07155 [SAR202 cluster bacterium Io17-Chloro-G4]